MRDLKNRTLTIHADASHCPETYATGIAYFIRNSDRVVKKSRRAPSQINSTDAEIEAVYQAVKHASRVGLLDIAELCCVVIRSDCRAVIDGLMCVGQHQDDKRLVRIRNRLSKTGIRLKASWIKGHQRGDSAGVKTNRWCDAQARRKMRAVRSALSS